MQYRITWLEKNLDGSESIESLSCKAKDREDALKQVNAVGNVIEIKKIEQV